MVVNFVKDGVSAPLQVVINDANCFSNDVVGRQVLFQNFESLLEKYPPCSVVRWDCSGMGGALHIFSRC